MFPDFDYISWNTQTSIVHKMELKLNKIITQQTKFSIPIEIFEMAALPFPCCCDPVGRKFVDSRAKCLEFISKQFLLGVF